jgi:pSer/pThr/pTyr-binding forkhead associated (FHA) protein
MYGLRYRLTADERAEQEAIAATVEAPQERTRLRNHILRLYDLTRNVYWDLDSNETLTIGRTLDNNIVIPSGYVSRLHCRIDHGHYLSDGSADGTPSKNGTYVNGKKLARRAILVPHDKICLGDPKLEGSYQLEVVGVERKESIGGIK